MKDARREFMVKAQESRYAWAKQVDPKAVDAFNAYAQSRRSFGKKK